MSGESAFHAASIEIQMDFEFTSTWRCVTILLNYKHQHRTWAFYRIKAVLGGL